VGEPGQICVCIVTAGSRHGLPPDVGGARIGMYRGGGDVSPGQFVSGFTGVDFTKMGGFERGIVAENGRGFQNPVV